MFKILINGIFWLITKLAEIIISPFITILTSLFPDLGVAFSHISAFFSYSLTYVPFIRDFMLIPTTALTFLFDYFVIKYSIYLAKIAINFSINIYNKLKP